MTITIDPDAGFCFGVKRAIEIAEINTAGNEVLFSLGEIVHNEEETKRLNNLGVRVISHEYLMNLKQGKVLFRAHGEPPSSYQTACRNGSTVIDATCPVVKKLQSRVLKSHAEIRKICGKVVIFGKKGHPEVIGLNGQIGNEALVISTVDEVSALELPPVVRLFAQTTMSGEEYRQVQEALVSRLSELYGAGATDLKAANSICGQVSGRVKNLRKFAAMHDVILFVAGADSSNGKQLYQVCRDANPHTYFISSIVDIRNEWLVGAESIGISGATSTPEWLLEEIRNELEKR